LRSNLKIKKHLRRNQRVQPKKTNPKKRKRKAKMKKRMRVESQRNPKKVKSLKKK